MKTKEFTPVQRQSTFHTSYPVYVWRRFAREDETTMPSECEISFYNIHEVFSHVFATQFLLHSGSLFTCSKRFVYSDWLWSNVTFYLLHCTPQMNWDVIIIKKILLPHMFWNMGSKCLILACCKYVFLCVPAGRISSLREIYLWRFVPEYLINFNRHY